MWRKKRRSTSRKMPPYVRGWYGGQEIVSKYHTGADRKTSYERIRGTTFKRPIVMFGESVWHPPLQAEGTKQEKGEAKMKSGIWLGVIERTEEYLISTASGPR